MESMGTFSRALLAEMALALSLAGCPAPPAAVDAGNDARLDAASDGSLDALGTDSPDRSRADPAMRPGAATSQTNGPSFFFCSARI